MHIGNNGLTHRIQAELNVFFYLKGAVGSSPSERCLTLINLDQFSTEYTKLKYDKKNPAIIQSYYHPPIWLRSPRCKMAFIMVPCEGFKVSLVEFAYFSLQNLFAFTLSLSCLRHPKWAFIY